MARIDVQDVGSCHRTPDDALTDPSSSDGTPLWWSDLRSSDAV